MPIFRKGDVSVLYVHVPKTGGSSIEDLFVESGWEVGLLDRDEPGSFNGNRRCSPQHMHAAVLRERLRLASFHLIFMTVRDPLARFRSEVVMRNPNLEEPWSHGIELFTRTTVRQLARDPYVHDNHLRPQHEFYVPGAHVFKFEDGLDRVAMDLRQSHGLDLEGEMPHNTARVGTMPGSAVAVPRHVRSQVLEIYREDYLRFGYDEPTD